MFKAKILETNEELLVAKRLLYKVYIEEINWKITENNPSGIRIEESSCGEYYLEDNYSEVSNWIGVYNGDNMVGCGRTTHRLNGLFDIENYVTVPYEISNEPKTIEASRLAILKPYRGTIAINVLWAFGIEYEINNGIISAMTTAPVPGVGSYYISKLGCKIVDIPAFKYSDLDNEKVNLLHLDMSDKTAIKQLIFELRNEKAFS